MADVVFDKKGFFFALKFFSFLVFLIFAAKFSSHLIFISALNQKNDVKVFEEQLASVNAGHQFLQSKSSAEVKIGFVGDVMLARGVEGAIKNFGDSDFRFPFLRIAEKLQEYDFLFGNLEGPVSDKGENLGSAYSFRMEPKAIDGLKFAGFDILSVANNHIGDWGEEAMKDAFSHLKEAGILYVGGGFDKEEAYKPRIVDIKGTKIAFLGFSQFGKNYLEAGGLNQVGLAFAYEDEIEKRTREAKEKSDIIVVSFHWGDEYQKEPNDYQKRIGRLAVEAGADLVIGHHPHVIQPVEKYQDSYIAYSLGNFVFDQNFSEETMEGLLLEAVIKNGSISEINPIEMKISDKFQPFLP